jgi:hypothetical protein
LQVGDSLRLANGVWKPILEIQVVQETYATYNFEVEKNHNYFVGQNGWLVHNDSNVAFGLGKHLEGFTDATKSTNYFRRYGNNHY